MTNLNNYTQTDLEQINTLVADYNQPFHIFSSKEEANSLAEVLEDEFGTETFITYDEDADVYNVQATEQTYITVEEITDSIDDEEGFDVILNTVVYDFNGKVSSYEDTVLKTYKTEKGAKNFASKQGYQVR